jgi:hypothetical protein
MHRRLAAGDATWTRAFYDCVESVVMAGLDPAIHVFAGGTDVDAIAPRACRGAQLEGRSKSGKPDLL